MSQAETRSFPVLETRGGACRVARQVLIQHPLPQADR